MNALNSQQWFKKLASCIGIVGAIALINFPLLAQYYPPLRLFQPAAYRRRLQQDDPDIKEPTSNIIEALDKQPEFQTVANALKQAALTETLKQKGPLTILAPSDEAFKALPDNILKQLLQPQNRAQLVTILKYHVIAGEVPAAMISQGGGLLPTVEGSPVQLTINKDTGEARLNEAQGMAPAIEVTNGVIVRVNKVLLPPSIATTLTLGSLNSRTQARSSGTTPPVSLNPVLPPIASRRGFFCDSSTIETKLQRANGEQQVWIQWRSREFDRAGYDPLRRCQEVSSRLETYRKNNQLNFITLGRMNSQNVICTGTQAGICTNLIYTLQPDEKDPIGALQSFLSWRTQSAGAASRLESKDDSVPVIDVRSILGEEGNTTPVTAPNTLTPQPQQPGNGGLPEL